MHRGECVTTGGLYRPTHHVSGGRGFAWGFRGGRGDLSSGLSQPGGKSC